MKRVLVVGAFVTVGFLIARTRVSRLRERLAGRCEAMFEQMPETFPPKKMLREIEATRADVARILELLECRTQVATTAGPDVTSSGAASDAA
jgi:hypothetical protein